MARVAVSQCPTLRVIINEEIQRKREEGDVTARRNVHTFCRAPRISTRPSVPPHVSRRVPAFLTRARAATPRLN